MPLVTLGVFSKHLKIDEEGYSTYDVVYKVEDTLCQYGIASVRFAVGLPLYGAPLDFGPNDRDLTVWRRAVLDVSPSPDTPPGEKPRLYYITYQFSNTPEEECKEQDFEDPLQKPQETEGAMAHNKEEAKYDRFGKRIVNSAHEQIRGAQVEFDDDRPTVRIVQNVNDLELPLCVAMRNHVNMFPLWGMPKRCIKLKSFTWKAKYYGKCYKYYERMFEFELNYNTWDRDLQDEATKVLHGRWGTLARDGTTRWVVTPIDSMGSGPGVEPDPDNPAHFIRWKDRNGENMRGILNGRGIPYEPEAEPNKKWWCINDGQVPIVFEGTCAQAVDKAFQSSARLDGPFDTEADANAGCSITHYEGANEPGQMTCSDNSTVPGRIHVEKYDEADFTRLRIPLSF